MLDYQAFGWLSRHEFGEVTWALTESGRAENERRLAAELDACGGRPVVTALHADFLPLNERHGDACTRWQLRRLPGGVRVFNDHTDHGWDDAVLRAASTPTGTTDDRGHGQG